MLKALAKNPANRYQSAGEMRADLLRAAAGRPVLATPVMSEQDRTAMISAPPVNRGGPPTRPTARVAPPPSRGNTWVAVALTLLGVLAVGALGLGLYVFNHNKTEVQVPDLNGLTAVQANQQLANAKLKPNPQNVTNPDCKQDTVTGQNPQAASKVDEGSTVSYTICVGPGSTTVPPLTGLSRDNADATLKNSHLTASYVTVDSDQPANTVVSSDPKQGTTVKAGSSVTVNLSNGKLKKLPSVVGSSVDDAKATLAAAGFTKVSTVQQDTNDSGKVGVVTGQDPDGNSLQDPSKTTVTIFVGRSPTPSAPPTTSGPTATASPNA